MNRAHPPTKLPPGAQTLVKHLVSAGMGSRRDAAELVLAGRVRVNGTTVTDLTRPVRARDRVTVDGQAARVHTKEFRYLVLNKPPGYLSTVSDDRGRKTVMDLVPEAERVPGLVPAGRLDQDSTGLVLLTNDGNLVDIVTHPRYGVEKEYRVRADRPLPPDRVRALLAGIALEEGTATAKRVRRLAEEGDEFRYAVTLVEGKKREVRRMLFAVGCRVLELERTRLGNITLGGLPRGQTRPLTRAELRGLLAAVDHPPRAHERPISPAGQGPRERGRRPGPPLRPVARPGDGGTARSRNDRRADHPPRPNERTPAPNERGLRERSRPSGPPARPVDRRASGGDAESRKGRPSSESTARQRPPRPATRHPSRPPARKRPR